MVSEQQIYEGALEAYSAAEAVLGPETTESTTEWWQEWIAIQSSRIEIQYMLGKVDEMTDLVEKTRPAVELYGIPVQRAWFYLNLGMKNIRREHYLISEEALSNVRSALNASQEAGDELQIAWIRFNLGFSYLFRGDLDASEEQLQAALAEGERSGDVKLQLFCLTYLSTLYRKYGRVKETRDFASRALTVATTLKVPHYIAMATANLAWVAWGEGKNAEAEQKGKAALEFWQSSEFVYPFHWAALWPLIDITLGRDELSQAVDYVRRLFAPGQQPLPDELIAVTEALIQAWDSGQPQTARTCLQQAIALAREKGYL
jgi:tetratricopeptide (TPR) repeat protein